MFNPEEIKCINILVKAAVLQQMQPLLKITNTYADSLRSARADIIQLRHDQAEFEQLIRSELWGSSSENNSKASALPAKKDIPDSE
jgi:hypothetical protein